MKPDDPHVDPPLSVSPIMQARDPLRKYFKACASGHNTAPVWIGVTARSSICLKSCNDDVHVFDYVKVRILR